MGAQSGGKGGQPPNMQQVDGSMTMPAQSSLQGGPAQNAAWRGLNVGGSVGGGQLAPPLAQQSQQPQQLQQNWGGQPEWQNWVGSTPGGGGSKGNQPGAMQGGMQQGGKGGMPGEMQSPYGPEMGRMGQPGGDQGGQYSGGSTMSANNQGTMMNATPGSTLGFGGQWWGDQMPQSPMGSFGGGPGQGTPGWGQQQPPAAAPAVAPPPAAPPPAAPPPPPSPIQQLASQRSDATIAANFDRLWKEDPTGRKARKYADMNTNWYQRNQMQVKDKYFGGDANKRNTWTNTYAGGGYAMDNVKDDATRKELSERFGGNLSRAQQLELEKMFPEWRTKGFGY